MVSDSSTDDERVPSRVLVEYVVCGEEGGKRGRGSRGNIVIVPLESEGVNLVLDLSEPGALFDPGGRSKGQDEWLETIQPLAPILQLSITKLGPAIRGADRPVTEI